MDGLIEAAALRAQAGLAALGVDNHIVHNSDDKLLNKVVRFETAERTLSFVKELLQTPVMQLDGGLPLPRDRADGADQRAAYVRDVLEQRYASLAHLDRVDGVVSGDLLDRLAATDRLHGDSGLELGTVGAALTHWREPQSGAVPRLRG